jgi:hypothetical protein
LNLFKSQCSEPSTLSKPMAFQLLEFKVYWH